MAGSREVPVTGEDVARLVLVALAMLGTGELLRRRSRRWLSRHAR